MESTENTLKNMLSILLKVIDESRKASHLIPIDEVNLPNYQSQLKYMEQLFHFSP